MRRTGLLVAGMVAVVCLTSILSAQDQPQRGRGRGFGFGGGFGTPAQLVMNSAVQEELKLSDEQKEKLRNRPRPDFGSLRDLSMEERAKKFQEIAEQSKKEVEEILDDAQEKRINEISLQVRGASALNDAAVAKKLELSEEQTKQIKEIAETRPTLGDGQRPDFAAIQKAREEREAKLLAVLNDDQKKKFEELKGPAFDVSKLRQGQGRRRNNNDNNN